MEFSITNRFTGKVQSTEEIDCTVTAPHSLKVGLAVKQAVKARANLAGTDLVRANLAGADLAGADLVRANLAGADLVRANLAGTDLAGANLAGASLAGANLVGANLVGADLVRANLAGADLAGADLVGANLAGANFAGAKWTNRITITQIPIQIYNAPNGWTAIILDNHMQIGCEIHSFEEWAKFSDRRILGMDGRKALEFWRQWKSPLLAICSERNATNT